MTSTRSSPSLKPGCDETASVLLQCLTDGDVAGRRASKSRERTAYPADRCIRISIPVLQQKTKAFSSTNDAATGILLSTVVRDRIPMVRTELLSKSCVSRYHVVAAVMGLGCLFESVDGQ